MAILVNIRRTGADAATPDQVRRAASGDWVISPAALDDHGDILLAIRRSRIVGAYDILSWEQLDSGRVRFDLRDSPELAAHVGTESPRTWQRGQANPVLLIDTAALDDPEPATQAATPARRGVHRVVIETKGLTDQAAAQLHHVLITAAGATGHLHDYRTTSLVREMRAAKAALDYPYRSAASPKAQTN